MMSRSSYPSDLSDDEWELLKPLIPIAPLLMRNFCQY